MGWERDYLCGDVIYYSVHNNIDINDIVCFSNYIFINTLNQAVPYED